METNLAAPPAGIAGEQRPSNVRHIVQLVFGGLALIAALGFFVGAGVLIWGVSTHRDNHGYFTTATHHYQTSSYGLVSESLNVSSTSLFSLFIDRLRITATGDQAQPLFIGIARTNDVDRYLGNAEHDWVGNLSADPFKVDYRRSGSGAPAGPPSAQRFWRVQAAGSGTQTISWAPSDGHWSAVAMNADGSRAVGANVQLAVSVAHLWWYLVGLLLLGGLSLAGGAALLYGGLRKRTKAT